MAARADSLNAKGLSDRSSPGVVMQESAYRARVSFLVPLILDTLLLCVLVLISLFRGTFPAETIILVIILLPLTYLLLESLVRLVSVGETGIRIQKLFRNKTLQWEDITNVDVMIIRKKIYLLLTTTKGFYILTNTFGNFTTLVQDITGHLRDDVVEQRVLEVAERSVVRRADVVAAWIAVAMLAIIIYLKFL